MQSLKLVHVAKRFGETEVLKNIDLEIEPGEFLILVGPSGCGKSTLLNCLAGLEELSAGEIWIGDRMVNAVSPKDRDIAMVFQSYALYPNMDVRGNIAFGMEMRGVPRAAREARVIEVARMLHMEDLLDRKPAQLSGGQRQRVAMGRALARSPGLFQLDVPLSNLDAKLRVEMRAEIKLLHQRTRITSVYVTHDQIEAMTLGSRIAIMKDGVIQQFGTPDDLYQRPANLFVAAFIGSPSMNFIPVTLRRDASGYAVDLASAIASLRVQLPGHAAYASFVDQEVTLGIRPESLVQVAPGSPHLGCPIDLVEPTGPDTLVLTHVNGARTVARVSPNADLLPGTQVCLAPDSQRLLLFDRQTGDRIGR